MSVRINTNMAAEIAHQNMATNDANMSKSIERLSSGMRINSAADDPAGLVISEQLRTQIDGLGQASSNTTDGINMIKTTESALNEVETQLQNIRDLTLHAATATSTADMKSADQLQVQQSLASIDRIANQTQFAGRYLLGDATAQGGQGNIVGTGNLARFQTGSQAGEVSDLTLANANAADVRATAANGLNLNTGVNAFATSAMAYTAESGATDTQTLSIKYTRADGTVDSYTATLANADGSGDTQAHAVTALNNAFNAQRPGSANAPKLVASAVAGNIQITLDPATNTNEYSAAANISVTQTALTGTHGFTGMTTNIAQTFAGTSGAIDLTTMGTDATATLAKIDAALTKVNNLRVNLGSFQSESLQSNQNRVASAQQNLTSSESDITDTDMAAEMVNFTKSQILTQAAQAMITQANTAPQNILQMLRG